MSDQRPQDALKAKEEGTPQDVTAYLKQRIKQARRRSVFTLVIGIAVMVVFYVLLASALTRYQEIHKNPDLVGEMAADEISSQLSAFGKDLEKGEAKFISNSTASVKKDLARFPGKFGDSLLKDIEARSERTLKGSLAELPSVLSSIVEEDPDAFRAALLLPDETGDDALGDDARGDDALAALLTPVLEEMVQRNFDKPDYGDYDTFKAVAAKLRRLKSAQDLTPEENLELQLLSIAASLLEKPKK